MLRKFFVMAAAITLTGHAFGQETTDKLDEKKTSTTLSGFVDAYFRSDFMKDVTNNRTSFTNSNNSFELGMASLKLDYSSGKVSIVADLGVGKRAQEFSYNESGLTAAIKQLYISYAATEWLKFTMGSWATHVGYELVDAPANRNYSMSYLFSWGPFFHTGLKAEATFGKSSLMFGVANPTDYKTAPLNSSKYILGQYGYTISDDIKIYLNYVGGKRWTDSVRLNQFDMVVTAALNDHFSLGYNGAICLNKSQVNNKYEGKAKTWWGSAVYVNMDPSDKFGLTFRSEYFSDRHQLAAMSMATEGAALWANTLSGNIHLGALTLIPELRLESATRNVFSNKTGELRKGDASILLAAVYKF